jgi:hypothetical protein
MRWITALLIGAILGFVLPMALGGYGGTWHSSWAGAGTIVPFPSKSPGLLFSVPLAIFSAIALRLFFNWHKG